MKPKDVKTFKDVCKLKRDHMDTKTAWILFNNPNELVIANQIIGQKPTGEVSLSRQEFQKFVDWWQSE
jgi:hypothetical protein